MQHRNLRERATTKICWLVEHISGSAPISSNEFSGERYECCSYRRGVGHATLRDALRWSRIDRWEGLVVGPDNSGLDDFLLGQYEEATLLRHTANNILVSAESLWRLEGLKFIKI
jgi:hypothetical protein